MFIVFYWPNLPNVNIVSKEDGTARLFETHAEAQGFAESELAFNWKIVEL